MNARHRHTHTHTLTHTHTHTHTVQIHLCMSGLKSLFCFETDQILVLIPLLLWKSLFTLRKQTLMTPRSSCRPENHSAHLNQNRPNPIQKSQDLIKRELTKPHSKKSRFNQTRGETETFFAWCFLKSVFCAFWKTHGGFGYTENTCFWLAACSLLSSVLVSSVMTTQDLGFVYLLVSLFTV